MKAWDMRSRLFLCALCATLCLIAACGDDRPAERATAGNTPASDKLPQTALPMPPVPESLTRRSHNQPVEPEFTLLDEQPMRLADYRGQVVVFDFYATWCPPCREEVPHLIDLQKRYAAQGLRIVGLNVGGPEDRAAVPGFVEDYGIQYELGYPTPEMADLYLSDNTTIPQTFVFDRRGQLIKRFVGYDSSLPAVLEETITAALAAEAD